MVLAVWRFASRGMSDSAEDSAPSGRIRAAIMSELSRNSLCREVLSKGAIHMSPRPIARGAQRGLAVLLCACIFFALASTPSRAFPELPGIGGGAPEQWFATGLPDAVTDVPFLDVYNPSYRVPMQEMPQGLHGDFLLGPGAYDLWAESYCLTPGAHRPGAKGHGDGYAYAPPKGKGAAIVQAVLRNASLHPDIPQHDIQVLLWALIAQTPYDKLDPKLQQLARELIDRNGIEQLQKAAQARQTAEVLSHVVGYLPGPVQQILNAESTLRGMLSGAIPGYGQIEAIAVAAGDPASQKGDREIVTGRWSYHPDGYFVSFFPSGYQSTLVELVNPGKLRIAIDKQGRVTRVSDQNGNSIETVYDEKVYAVPGEPGLSVCPFKTVKFRKVIPWRPEAPVTLEVQGQGYTVVGMPQGQAEPPAGQGALSTLPARFRWTVTHRKQMEALTASICKLNKRPEDNKARKDFLPILVNVGGWAQGLRVVLLSQEAPGKKVDVSLANPAYEAWQAAVVVFGEAAKKPTPAFEHGGPRIAASDLLAGDWDDAPGPAPGWLKPFGPSNGVSQPGNQGRQRLGLSGRGNRDRNRNRPPGRRRDPSRRDDDSESPDKDAWKNKDILVKARECMGWVEGISDAASFLDGPAEYVIGEATDLQGGVKDAMFDWMFESAGQISQSLGGDPPRPDFDQITLPAKVDIQALCKGMKSLPSPDGLLGTMAELDGVLQAAQIARDRLGGAVSASNAQGVYRQAMVLVELKRRAGLLWVRAADRLDEAATRVEKRKIIATPEQAAAYKARMTKAAFNKVELDAARRLGISPDRLEELRKRRLTLEANPSRRPLPDVLHDVAAAYRELGEMWSCLPAVEGLR